MPDSPNRQPPKPASRPVPASRPRPLIVPPPPVQRPLGITILAILNFVLATLFLALIALTLANSADGSYTLACLAILPVAISTGLGVALWRMLPWARNTAIVLYVVYAFSALLNIFSRPVTISDIAGILIPAVIVAYLLQPSVREAFERNANVPT